MTSIELFPAEKQLSIADFESIFEERLPDFVRASIGKSAFHYRDFTMAERDELLLKIFRTLILREVPKAGEHRLEQWETGWKENLDLFLRNPSNISSLMPKYFNKYGAVRFAGNFIKPISEHFECNTLGIILDWVADKYLRDANRIFEFGCGTGHNLLRVRQVNSGAELCGLDWTEASQKILNEISKSGVAGKISGRNFNYFEPDPSCRVDSSSVVYTVASLEQIGDKWGPFVNYLLEQKPKLCIHIEPIAEVLDPENLMDYLSISYFQMRNYLSGFLDGLRQLEKENRVKIETVKRTHIGSLFIEGYTIVVWSPI